MTYQYSLRLLDYNYASDKGCDAQNSSLGGESDERRVELAKPWLWSLRDVLRHEELLETVLEAAVK